MSRGAKGSSGEPQNVPRWEFSPRWSSAGFFRSERRRPSLAPLTASQSFRWLRKRSRSKAFADGRRPSPSYPPPPARWPFEAQLEFKYMYIRIINSKSETVYGKMHSLRKPLRDFIKWINIFNPNYSQGKWGPKKGSAILLSSLRLRAK